MLVDMAAQVPYRRGVAQDPRLAPSIAHWQGLPVAASRIERVRDIDVSPQIVEVFDILSEAYEASAVYDRVSPRDAVAAAAREARTVLRATR